MTEFYKLKESFIFIHGHIDSLVYGLNTEVSNEQQMKEINDMYNEIYNSITKVSTEILENVFSSESTKRDDYISLVYSFFENEKLRITQQLAPIENNDYFDLYDFDKNVVFIDEFEKVFIELKEERKFVLDIYRRLVRTMQRIGIVFFDFPKESMTTNKEEPKLNNPKRANFNSKELFTLLKELDLFNVSPFKSFTRGKKEIILSILLNCNNDYARDLLAYNEHQYSSDEKNGIKLKTREKIKKVITD